MHDLSKLYSQNNLVICKPSRRAGVQTKKTEAGLGFVSQQIAVVELEVLSPTAADAGARPPKSTAVVSASTPATVFRRVLPVPA